MCRVMRPDVAQAPLSAPTDIQTGAHCFGSGLSVPVQQESNCITSRIFAVPCDTDTLKVNSVLRIEQTEGQGGCKGVGQLTRQNVPPGSLPLWWCTQCFPLTYMSLSWSEQTAWFSGNMSLTCCIMVFKMASRWALRNRHTHRFLLIHGTGFESHSLNYFLHNHALKPFIHKLPQLVAHKLVQRFMHQCFSKQFTI